MINVLKAVGLKESAKKKDLFCKLQFKQLTVSIEWKKKSVFEQKLTLFLN